MSVLVRVYVCYNEEEKEKVEVSGLSRGLDRERGETKEVRGKKEQSKVNE